MVVQREDGASAAAPIRSVQFSTAREDFRNFVRLAQSFDVIHMTGPSVEPQDIAPTLPREMAGG